MTPGIYVKCIRDDYTPAEVEYRVIDLDNDREPIRDGDIATVSNINSATFAQIREACRQDSINRGYGYFS